MQVFILAGGFATRLWPLTERRAKPLLAIAGKPILTYAVEAVPSDLPITVSTNAVFAEDFRVWQKTIKGKKLTVSIEDAGHEGEKFGALGAVAHWITDQKIDDDVLLLAGDNYAAADMSRFIGLFRGHPLVAGHDIGDPELARQFGTIIAENSEGKIANVTSFEEKPLHPKSTVVSTGWWILPRTSLPVLVEYAKTHPDNVGGIFEEFLKQKIAVDCFVFGELWKDIGSFEAYMALHREIVGEKVIADASATVGPDCTLGGSVDIGRKSTVRASTLTDCIIFGGSTITDCVLERCVIDEGCELQGVDLTDKMIRAGTVLKLTR